MISIIIPCKNEPDILKMLEETEKFFPEAQIITSNDRYGYGKGWALFKGLQHATGDTIVFIDGDLDIHPREINKLLPYLEISDIVVGRKELPKKLSRKVITFCSRLFIGILFGLWIDTQTGIKAFKRQYLPDWTDESFAFDLEILSKAKRMGASITEVPVEVSIKKSMPLRSITRFIWGAIKIRLHNS